MRCEGGPSGGEGGELQRYERRVRGEGVEGGSMRQKREAERWQKRESMRQKQEKASV